MKTRMKGLDSDVPALLTLDDFIKLAGDRGKKLWLESNGKGGHWTTDGAKLHSLPVRLPGGRLPSGLVEVLVSFFFGDDPVGVDFALDPRKDD